MALGILAILNLPVERYPDIAPPKITVSTNYSGADAKTVEQSVTQVLEQQIQRSRSFTVLSVQPAMQLVVAILRLVLKWHQIPIQHRFKYKIKLVV